MYQMIALIMLVVAVCLIAVCLCRWHDKSRANRVSECYDANPDEGVYSSFYHGLPTLNTAPKQMAHARGQSRRKKRLNTAKHKTKPNGGGQLSHSASRLRLRG
jgi:hypothetical protein